MHNISLLESVEINAILLSLILIISFNNKLILKFSFSKIIAEIKSFEFDK